MSASFYPAKQESEKVWGFVEVPYEVNLSNSNTRIILSELGLNTEFEDANTKEQDIDDFIERCHVLARGGIPDGALIYARSRDDELYILHKVAMLLVSATLGKQGGATHWYFA
tara:strand:- start:2221 stop:2559 length:339 start_codon:yes stop_codon:yes gene_type:complete